MVSGQGFGLNRQVRQDRTFSISISPLWLLCYFVSLLFN